MPTHPAPDRHAFYTCPLCEATCGLDITLRGQEILHIRGDKEDVRADVRLSTSWHVASPQGWLAQAGGRSGAKPVPAARCSGTVSAAV